MWKKNKKIRGDEYLAMKKEKKSKGRNKVEKVGFKAIVALSSALSAVVLGYSARKFAGQHKSRMAKKSNQGQ